MKKILCKYGFFILVLFLISLGLKAQSKKTGKLLVKTKNHVSAKKVASKKTLRRKIVHKKVYNKASYYLRAFHGRKTANGEFYNKNDFTCAHRYYRFNTLLKITNIRNNKSVIVRVNDRGPFSKKRIIDLSEAAAHSIDMIQRGVIAVKITMIHPDSLFKLGKLELFSMDTTYNLYGALTTLDGPAIYLWKTYNLGHLILLSTTLSDRLPPNELVLRKKSYGPVTKYELYLKCKAEESQDLLKKMKELGFLRAHL
jgi:rare lipoprotein A